MMTNFEAACFHDIDGNYRTKKHPSLVDFHNQDYCFGTTLLSSNHSLSYWKSLKKVNGHELRDDGFPNHQYGHPILLNKKLSKDLSNAALDVLSGVYKNIFNSFETLSRTINSRILFVEEYPLYHDALTSQLYTLLDKGFIIPFVYDSILSFEDNKIVPKVIEMQSHIGYMTWSRDMYSSIPKDSFMTSTTFVSEKVIDQTKKIQTLSGGKPIIVLDLNPVHGPSALDERGMHSLLSSEISFPGSLYDIYSIDSELYIDVFGIDGQITNKAVRLRDCSIICRMLYDDILQLKSNIGKTILLGKRKIVAGKNAFSNVQKLLTDTKQTFLWHTNWSYIIDKSDMELLKEFESASVHMLDMFLLHDFPSGKRIKQGRYICKPSNGISGRGSFYVYLEDDLSIDEFLLKHVPSALQHLIGPDKYILQKCLDAAPIFSPHYDDNMNVIYHPSICEIRTMAFPGIGTVSDFDLVSMARVFPKAKHNFRNNTTLLPDQYVSTNMGKGTQELHTYFRNRNICPDYRKSSYGRSPVVVV